MSSSLALLDTMLLSGRVASVTPKSYGILALIFEPCLAEICAIGSSTLISWWQTREM